MRAIQKQARLVEWLSAEDMHAASLQWLSELKFIKVEQVFFDDLIKSYTLQLIDEKHFEKINKVIKSISEVQKKNTKLIEAVQLHENKLEIIVDGIDQIKEEVLYKNKHREILQLMNDYLRAYQLIKKQLFEIVKIVMKQEKQKRLLN